MARIHELKCDCGPFSDLVSGRKTCEVRENDRLYEVDDILRLREGIRTPDGYTYTGREARRIVTHVQAGYGLTPGLVVLSVRELTPPDERAAFEAYVRRTWPDAPLHHRGDGYMVPTVGYIWDAWQARAAIAVQALHPAFNAGDSHMVVTGEAAAGISSQGNACAYRETCRALLPQHGFEALPEALFDQLLGATAVRDEALEEAASLCENQGAMECAALLRNKKAVKNSIGV